jgi:hypothetical protein
MIYIAIISVIIFVFIFIVLNKNNSKKKSFITFNKLNDIHETWNEKLIETINENIKPLKTTTDTNIRQFINDLKNVNNYDKLSFEINETKDNNNVIYYTKLIKQVNNIKIKLNVVFKEFDTIVPIIHYMTNKSKVFIKTNYNCFIYEYNKTLINSEYIQYNMMAYFKVNDEQFIEIPFTITAKINPYNLKQEKPTIKINI